MAQLVGSHGKVYAFDDLVDTHSDFMFISAVIINRERANGVVPADLTAYVADNIIQLAWPARLDADCFATGRDRRRPRDGAAVERSSGGEWEQNTRTRNTLNIDNREGKRPTSSRWDGLMSVITSGSVITALLHCRF